MHLSGRPLTLAALALAAIGLVLSGYLTYVHFNPGALVCSGDGCSVVQQSQYSKMFGIPIAIFGVGMFAVLIAAILLREARTDLAEHLGTGIVLILVAAMLYWAYLTYLEAYVIHAFCQWCVVTSIVTGLLLVIEGYRWYQGYIRTGLE